MIGIDSVLANNLIIREWLNGGLLPLNLSLVVVIALFLWGHARAAGSYRSFIRRDGVATACALFWVFTADAVRAGLVWDILWSAPLPAVTAATLTVVSPVNVGLMLAGVCSVISTLRCIYLFTPPRWSSYYWVMAALVTLMFQLLTHLNRA